MRTQTVALIRVQRLFKQRTEDRGVDLFPGVAGGLPQFADFLAAERQCRAIPEELAVEFLYLCFQHMRPCAQIHRFPELADIVREGFRVLLAFLQHFLEGFFRQKADIFREHREQTAHQEHRHVLRRIVLLLQRERHLRETLGNIARHLRRGLCRIK